MRAKIIKIKEQKSKYGGTCFLITFKSDGKSYRSWLSPQCGNFKRWANVLQKAKTDEVWLDGLIVKGGRLIDADSDFLEMAV